MPWSIEEWGNEVWGGAGIKYGTLGPDGEPVEIPAGSLDAIGTVHARLWKQLEPAQSWVDLIGIVGGVFQDIEETLQSIADNRYVGNAPGQVLDEIGALVNLPRGGQSNDAAYRLAIIAEATSLVVSGTAPEILDLAVRLAPASTIHIADLLEAAFVLTISDLSAANLELIALIMADTPAAGVGAWIETYTTGLTGGWSSVYGPISGPAGGWASTYGATSVISLWSSIREMG